MSTVTATVETKAVKSVTLVVDEETASCLYDVLVRHVIHGGVLSPVAAALRRAGVDTTARFKNLNEYGIRASGYGEPYALLELIKK